MAAPRKTISLPARYLPAPPVWRQTYVAPLPASITALLDPAHPRLYNAALDRIGDMMELREKIDQAKRALRRGK